MIRVDVYLADPAGLLEVGSFGAGALIRIEFSTDGGTIYTEAGTVAIDVVTVQPFEYWHAAGTATTLYRWRVSNAGNTVQSPYSDPKLGVNVTATSPGRSYADIGDVLALFQTKPKPAQYSRLAALLQTATDEWIRHMAGQDFFRHPASGTATWLAEGNSSDVIHAHEGIVSLTTVEVSFDRGETFEALEATEWKLEGVTPHESLPIPDGEPAFHVRLLWPYPRITRFSPALGTARFTGVRGYPTIPIQLREGIAQRARQMAYADPSFTGSVPGPAEYNAGGSTFEYWPQILYRFFEDESIRFMACSL